MHFKAAAVDINQLKQGVQSKSIMVLSDTVSLRPETFLRKCKSQRWLVVCGFAPDTINTKLVFAGASPAGQGLWPMIPSLPV